MLLVKLTALTDLMVALPELIWHMAVEARDLEADFGEVTAAQIDLMSIRNQHWTLG
jgi:hypothetical protein